MSCADASSTAANAHGSLLPQLPPHPPTARVLKHEGARRSGAHSSPHPLSHALGAGPVACGAAGGDSSVHSRAGLAPRAADAAALHRDVGVADAGATQAAGGEAFTRYDCETVFAVARVCRSCSQTVKGKWRAMCSLSASPSNRMLIVRVSAHAWCFDARALCVTVLSSQRLCPKHCAMDGDRGPSSGIPMRRA